VRRCGRRTTRLSRRDPLLTGRPPNVRRRSRRARRRARRRAPLPRIGTLQLVRAEGTSLSVRVTRVLDPLADSGATLVPGTRPVGVQITIHNDGSATYDSTSSGDLALITSAGPATPLFVGQGVCATPLTDFESLIGAGEGRSGCVGFSVRDRARILAVRFSPDSRAPGTVSWGYRGR
jgi:hypothetical protein